MAKIKKKISIVWLILAACALIFLSCLGLKALFIYAMPETWRPYTHTIKHFNQNSTTKILDTYQIVLPNKAKINRMEEKKSGFYTLTISGIENIDEFINENPIIPQLMDIKENDGHRRQETMKPACYYGNNNIYIVTYCIDTGKYPTDLKAVYDYNKSVEDLFKNMWKEKQS